MPKTTRMITLDQALERVIAAALVARGEGVRLTKAHGRVLAQPVLATRDQPPFNASSMDGYAVRAADLTGETISLRVIGESIAGRAFDGAVTVGEAVRIFTGAPVPADCDAIVIQENAVRTGDVIEVTADGRHPVAAHIRRQGQDFAAGDELLAEGVRLDPWRLSLAAAAGAPKVLAAVRPRIAVLCTGDELVLPGDRPRTDQIYESASHALIALIKQWGGEADYLGVEGDTTKVIYKAVRNADADLIVTVGGASVGDYDLVFPALEKLGLDLAFASIAVRPGKPTHFGWLDDGRRVLGLPGNPASAFVMAQLLLKPWIETSLGLDAGNAFVEARLAQPLPANGPREHFLRGRLSSHNGGLEVTAFDDQDSSLVSVFAAADCLIRQPANSPALDAGDLVALLPLERL